MNTADLIKNLADLPMDHLLAVVALAAICLAAFAIYVVVWVIKEAKDAH